MKIPPMVDFLEKFDSDYVGNSKGALSMIVTLNRKLMGLPFPVDESAFQTEKRGQISGLGGSAIKKILKEHGIFRTLSSEGGRTSRGNMERMIAYIEGVNDLYVQGNLDLEKAEDFWVERVRIYFDSQPFTFKLDPALSIKSCIRNLLEQARQRQREASGTMYVGAMMQHLVGAKLKIVSTVPFDIHGFSVADSPSNRSGDFLLGDVVFHVTTAPSDALIEKCVSNLSSGLHPLIVTTSDGIGGLRALAVNRNVESRIDAVDFEQFMTSNLHEHGQFHRTGRMSTTAKLIKEYNEIVAGCESDPSLRIEFDEG